MRTFMQASWTLQYVPERILFFRLLEGIICGPWSKNVVENSAAKNDYPISLLFVVSKVLYKTL